MRLFVAIEIVPPLRDAIASLRGSLAGVRWTDPLSYHLTLRFIGDVRDRARQEDIHHALMAIRAPTCTLSPQGPGVFEQEGGLDRLWIGVARSDPLMHLQRKVDTAIRRAAGLQVERRRFLPHVTIGSVARPPPPVMSAWLTQWGTVPPPPADATHFTLFRSLRGPDQPLYDPLAEYPLG
ncbi:2'-5' RNA ligase [Gluconacetobacter diazotrophicus PA1 5]|uniref:RNA 2',3'-cyclic phosphodiesterase n=2 Tax=Gluconacetobacter diazotrophicus TaxID=33996 RepID=A9HK09_GLUDA|nr:RNA 2',3'-cyclic phosphodiesterase [Gluconacetobacter diazotrophicus]ACI50058.1 2'-5' RNA ligase [Gluconacetobacter diazotrophicus PA1 5]MBB2156248.1 RNA 2',3'-cyclic phosphodiesterase [Gluconacetobacter diazotrophicus]TWB07862.1 2'-5' RNA ligase [Gluconacetobacter diazotrophicus]CAP55982.1 putative 2'-5' RNA ligase [Gluconacetobacter diazotrophicus PA1 5]